MITSPTNHYSSPHNSPPGFDGSMNNRTIPINLFPELLLENKINDKSELENNELYILAKVYYFTEMYLSGKVSFPNYEINTLKSYEINTLKNVIESFKTDNCSIEKYYVISPIINGLLRIPFYANVLNIIENKMVNNNDVFTKKLLNVLLNNFNTFLPILLPGLFSNFYDNHKKEFNVWGTTKGFNINSIVI